MFYNEVKKCFHGTRNDLADLLVSFVKTLADDGDFNSAKKLLELAMKEKQTETLLKEALRLSVQMQEYELGIKYATDILAISGI